MLNDRSSTLALLRTRRSGRPRDMVEPGPDAGQLREMLEIAMRVPDHGKLAPWRFVHVPRERRADLAALLHRAFRRDSPDPSRTELEAVDRFAHQAPTLVVVLSCPIESAKIPVWEQELSCGAACMNLLIAAHAQGFVGGWITGWPTYSEEVRAAFTKGSERIAAFIFIGTPGQELQERPRPDYAAITSEWSPPPPTPSGKA